MANKKPSDTLQANTSQDFDRKHKQDHNLTAVKGNPSKKDDKRDLARQEHTNHFTNRTPDHNS